MLPLNFCLDHPFTHLFPIERDLVELERRLGLIEQFDGGHAVEGLGEADVEPADVHVLVVAVHRPKHRGGYPSVSIRH